MGEVSDTSLFAAFMTILAVGFLAHLIMILYEMTQSRTVSHINVILFMRKSSNLNAKELIAAWAPVAFYLSIDAGDAALLAYELFRVQISTIMKPEKQVFTHHSKA